MSESYSQMAPKFCYLYLTCAAAQKEIIAQTLLEKRLIVCAKFVPIEAMYLWHGNIEREDETLIVMEAPSDNFSAIEDELASIHDYETFVLTAVPITHISRDASKWMEEELA